MEFPQPADSISLDMFRSLVEESLTGVYLIQGERLVYCNPRLAEIFGYSRQEMLALRSVLELVDPIDRDLVADNLRQRPPGRDGQRRIHHSRNPQGRSRHLRRLAQRADDEGGDAGGDGQHGGHHRAQAPRGGAAQPVADRRADGAVQPSRLFDAGGAAPLARAAEGQDLLLVLADIDGLKPVNDTFGHAAGDQVVIDAANVLKGTYRRVDIIARIGGDEFTAFPIEAGPDSAEILMNRLQENIAKHNERYTRPFRLSMSVGIGRINPADCPNVQRLLAEADRELYRRKRDRKDGDVGYQSGRSAAW